MANEAVLIVRTGHPIGMTVADGAAIEKGAVLKMADLTAVAGSSGAEDVVGGIAASEKVADDGKTKLGVYREGIFRVTASGTITVGQAVSCKGTANLVIASTAGAIGGETLGIAFETAAEGETFLMELRPGCNNNAYS